MIDDFVARYVKEYDFYEQVARTATEKLAADLQTAGVRCIVTSRAKSITRLREKCQKRLVEKCYSTVEEIYEDIIDLAGVRVALYFPAEREIVDQRINHLFEVLEPRKNFPERDKSRPGAPRFEGYAATHYRVRLREENATEQENRYAAARLEIQVASVLMHAWSEVEHDLVYKPAEGELSGEELALLDQLNGLVVAGEIALEALQAAARRRVNNTGSRFSNHYELAAYLLSQVEADDRRAIDEIGVGRVDILFALLISLGIDTPGKLEGYLEGLHGDVEKRPLSAQVIDALLLEKSSRYDVYRQIKKLESVSHREEPRENEQVGRFIKSWITFESLERDVIRGVDPSRRSVRPVRALQRLEIFDSKQQDEIEHYRKLRNALVHGIEPADPEQLSAASRRLDKISSTLRLRQRPRSGETAR